MSSMFYYARSFNGELSLWDVGSVTNMHWLFKDSAHSTGNYDQLLINWSILPVQSGVNFTTSAQYSAGAAAAARASLIADHGWSITDAGEVP